MADNKKQSKVWDNIPSWAVYALEYGIEVLKTVDIRSPKTVISVHFSYSLPMAMQIY